jgi:hypothetical protein
MRGEFDMLLHFARGLRRFYAEPITCESARQTVKISVEGRERAFLSLVERAVFGLPESPYRWLFQRCGIGFGDLAAMVRRGGLEETLGRLLDAGIYLSIDEFKGRSPLRRGREEYPGPSVPTDNPLMRGHFEAASSGSTGSRRRMVIDLDHLRYEACCNLLFLESAGIREAPLGLWRPVPPGSAGMKSALRSSVLGLRFERWFTQVRYSPLIPDSKSWAVTTTALIGSRLWGSRIPLPEYVPLDDAARVAAWMHAARSAGKPPHLDTNVSAALLVARAAGEKGLDISQSFFRTGSEPLTVERAAILKQAGCRVVAHYSIAETGPVAVACCDGVAPDDTHLLEGKMAVVMRAGVAGIHAPPDVEPIFLTTLLPTAPKIMINVESGDTAVRQERDCRCIFSELGLRTHLHTIRSYEKLTAGGMHFLGSVLIRLIEETLPQRVGGDPADYQFVELEHDAGARVALRVHPRLGMVNENRLRELVAEELAKGGPADKMMANLWRQGSVLEIHRSVPEATAGSKVLPLRFGLKRELKKETG